MNSKLSELIEMANTAYPNSKTVEWNRVELEVKHTLSLDEATEFVATVTMACFDEEDSVYYPELFGFVTKRCILKYYVGMDIDGEHDDSGLYHLVYGTDIIPTIYQSINQEQLDMLIRSAEAEIEYLVKSNIKRIERDADEVVSQIEKIVQDISGTFSGISGEDMANLVHSISDGKFDLFTAIKSFIDKNTEE